MLVFNVHLCEPSSAEMEVNGGVVEKTLLWNKQKLAWCVVCFPCILSNCADLKRQMQANVVFRIYSLIRHHSVRTSCRVLTASSSLERFYYICF